VIPGLLLVVMYLAYVLVVAYLRPADTGGQRSKERTDWLPLVTSLVPPLLLVFVVLGSIFAGFATPTEAAGVGAMGALLLALAKRQLSWQSFKETCTATTKTTVMVFTILVGASVFSLVFRGFGGEELIEAIFHALPGGAFTATLVVMLVIFLLGFILDFIEITFVVVPLVAPVLLMMGIDPIWLGIMIAVNLQTSFLTPPFGFALFYLRGVAPKSVMTADIYRSWAKNSHIELRPLIGTG
jgi:tripartite ATP-independent transporter DctM subunit